MEIYLNFMIRDNYVRYDVFNRLNMIKHNDNIEWYVDDGLHTSTNKQQYL